ncbi:MAG: hypothetical protein M3Q16_08000 [Pseudomonadota bacterium]|nr:hypothetical protein [Pseudomonadota bacterium]
MKIARQVQGVMRRVPLLDSSIAGFLKEKAVKKQNCDDRLEAFSALLDKGAEVFTKKMFKHSQSKAQERWNDMEQDRRGKKSFTSFTIGSKSCKDEFDLG